MRAGATVASRSPEANFGREYPRSLGVPTCVDEGRGGSKNRGSSSEEDMAAWAPRLSPRWDTKHVVTSSRSR